jgi:hypothetical protein
MEYEDGKYKRIVDFYVTDDENHIPVRLDMFLKFGSARQDSRLCHSCP